VRLVDSLRTRWRYGHQLAWYGWRIGMAWLAIYFSSSDLPNLNEWHGIMIKYLLQVEVLLLPQAQDIDDRGV
jgi:hypothetical protein